VEIPYDKLSEIALVGIIEEFVLREGTEYGHRDYSLEEKVELVKKQLKRGLAKVVYDPEVQSCNIVPSKALG